MVSTVEEEKSSSTVEVPSMDSALDNFFQTSDTVAMRSSALEVSVDDFNELFLVSNDM